MHPEPTDSRSSFLRLIGLSLLTPALTLAGCDFASDSEDDHRVDITVSSFGIPHIKAETWSGLGYGYGYHFASDNLCLMAEHLLRVRGELSATFGTEEDPTNFSSDIVLGYYLSDEQMKQPWQQQDEKLRDLMTGYAEGYNRYLREIPEDRHVSCRNEAWLKNMQPLDVMRLGYYVYYLSSVAEPQIMQALLDVAPTDELASQTDLPGNLLKPSLGSNAWGLSTFTSQNRRPLLLGNPHYPWHGVRRFYQAHMTIPGEMDVMGAAIYGSPLINIGFTRNFAWTHTVSTSKRFVLYELKLKPDDPFKYLYDGIWLPIRSKELVVDVLENNQIVQRKHSLYFTEFGPLLNLRRSLNNAPWMNWPNAEGNAYAIRFLKPAPASNPGAQSLAMATAADLDGLIAALQDHLGLSFVNTVAVENKGRAWYGDISAVPYLSDIQWDTCPTSATGNTLAAALGRFQPGRVPFPVLDGSQSFCQWKVDNSAPTPGIMPASMLPQVTTSKALKYVANSNDSYWLTNAGHPLEGYPRILGPERYRISLRSQMGLSMIEDRISGTDNLDIKKYFTLENLKKVALLPRNGAGERFASELGLLCLSGARRQHGSDTSAACQALSQWKLSNSVEDRGAMFFNRIWPRIEQLDDLFYTPYDWQHGPLTTPTGLSRDKTLQQKILDIMKQESAFFSEHGLDPAAPLGDLQYVVRNDRRIPIAGGPPGTGSFNMIQGSFDSENGWSDVEFGNSYIQVVSWTKDAKTVQAEAILTYSQSTDPASPHYADQTALYSEGGWVTLPFTEEEVEKSAVRTYSLSRE